jgi:saccharopine dehydrogenase (NADP+, L-glutamate forming)
MIVMWHRFVYKVDGQSKEVQSALAVKGKDEKNTAMAKTVGLPLGIVAKLFLQGKILQRGVCIPVSKEFYEPVLAELKNFGIDFKESFSVVNE